MLVLETMHQDRVFVFSLTYAQVLNRFVIVFTILLIDWSCF